MARWTKIDRRLQNDAKYRALSMEGQWVFLTIMTHPSQTALGAMRGTMEGLAAETGKPFDRIAKGFAEAIESGMLEYDPDAAYIGLPNFLRHNSPASGKVVLSWSKCLDYIPECGLKSLLLQRVTAFAKTLPKAFQKRFDTVSKEFSPEGPQKQDQDQEQKQEENPPNPPQPGGKNRPSRAEREDLDSFVDPQAEDDQ